MEAEILKWFATLGIGGVLAGFIFVFYRKDIKQYTELWRTTSEHLMKIVGENTASITRLSDVIDNLDADIKQFRKEE